MPEIALSESATAVLRFRVRGYRMPARERHLAAFRELVEAGIMEPDGEDFRFTTVGWTRRDEILRAAEERIERERFAPPDASRLSESARGLLRRIASGDRVEISGQNRQVFRELAAARIIYLMHTFAKGDESGYRFTYWGWQRRFEIIAHPAQSLHHGQAGGSGASTPIAPPPTSPSIPSPSPPESAGHGR
jgi:hypothetical protein